MGPDRHQVPWIALAYSYQAWDGILFVGVLDGSDETPSLVGRGNFFELVVD